MLSEFWATGKRPFRKPLQRISLGVWLVVVILCGSQASLAAPPTLTNLFPAGGQRGSKVVVTCTGTFNWPTKVWAPGVDVTPTAESGKIEVSIPADLPADRVWVRLYDAEGASVAAPFLIGSLPETAETEPNNRLAEATQVEHPQLTVNGSLKDADVDCFAVRLSAGQSLVAALDANTRIGSPMDAILQVVSLNGIVLAENHDDLKLDPRLSYSPPKDGIYIVRLFAFPSTPDTSIRFNGGANHIYRLTLSTGPLVTHAIPLSAPLANPGQLAAAGWNLPSNPQLSVVPFGGSRLGDSQEFEVNDDLRRLSDARIGFAFTPDFRLATRVRLTPIPTLFEQPVLEAHEPLLVTIPASVTGCLKRPKVTNDYRIPLQKGQQVILTVESRSLDLLLDPVMKLTDPTGTVVADIDDSGATRDCIIGHTAAHDGDYRLSISDRFRKGGDRSWYLLTARNEQADLELSLAGDSVNLEPDKPTEVPVKILRRATSSESIGPITIQVSGLPEGISAPSVVSEISGPTATEVKLLLTSNGNPFSGPIRITGKVLQPRELERAARTPARLGVQFDSAWLTATKKP